MTSVFRYSYRITGRPFDQRKTIGLMNREHCNELRSMRLFLIFMLTVNYSVAVQGKSLEFDISSLQLKNGTEPAGAGICSIPGLSQQQIYIYNDIRKLHFSHSREVTGKLELQRQSYEKVLKDRNVKVIGFADEIADKYFETKLLLSKRKTAFFHTVFYKILLADQRDALLKCLK